MIRTAVVTLIGSMVVAGLSQPAFAADGTDPAPLVAQELTLTAGVVAPRVQHPLTLVVTEPAPLRRPAVLPALYVGLAATEAFDAYSTQRGLAHGARETNPLAQGDGAAFWAVKADGTVVPIVVAERMWKTNKVAAVVTMVLANGVMAAVAANNVRVLRRQR